MVCSMVMIPGIVHLFVLLLFCDLSFILQMINQLKSILKGPESYLNIIIMKLLKHPQQHAVTTHVLFKHSKNIVSIRFHV